jgi:DNA-binding NtrC family response regulator
MELDTASGTHKRTILFVDDERRVLTSMRAMFRREYNVLLANSGAEALALMSGNRVDVIISDQRMPGMTGVEVLKQVKVLAPNAMRILLTGYADLAAIEASINEGEVFRYLTKPCAADELKEAIGLAAGVVGSDALAGPAPPRERRLPKVIAEEAPSAAPGASLHIAAQRPVRSATVRPAHTGAYTASPGGRASASQPVDVLLFTEDAAMVAALQGSLEGKYRIHAVRNVDAAVTALESHPVGVLVTDTAVSEDAITALTTTLKRHVPELVTIVASARSDAQLLIELINYGQIFRFLLKPLHPGQCRLSVESAVIKHRALAADPRLHVRHAVAERGSSEAGMVHAVFGRIRRLRDRFFALNGMA